MRVRAIGNGDPNAMVHLNKDIDDLFNARALKNKGFNFWITYLTISLHI